MPIRVRSGPTRSAPGSPPQSLEELAAALEAFLAQHPGAVVTEDGKVLFDMRFARYTLSTEHSRCTLHLWSEDRNLVRHITASTLRVGTLRLTTHRFGQTKPAALDLIADRDRRTPTNREATRTRYLRVLDRILLRHFGEWKQEGFRTAMDLERSFGPAYARGTLVQGQNAWAVIAVNAEESPATVDGILTLGILWLAHCREQAGGRRLYQGLRLIVPKGMATLTLSRLRWMNQAAAQWELFELDERSEELEPRDALDQGNLTTRLIQAPNEGAARERFAEASARILALVPEAMRAAVELRVRSGAELAFLLHGLEFARVRTGYTGQSFNRAQEITFGAGANETALTDDNAGRMHELVGRLFARRSAVSMSDETSRQRPDRRDPLYRMAPERWLESVLRRDVSLLDAHLNPAHVYTQVPAFAASDRGMLDLLTVVRSEPPSPDSGRLAVLELKADEDLHLALQGLDYWVRVRWHHVQDIGAGGGVGEFQRHGYFPGVRLAAAPPKLYLVAPALRIHPATEIVLRHFAPEIDWTLAALDERWRQQIKVVWRKRSHPVA